MLTSSTEQSHIDDAYEAGADGYLLKGKNISAFTYIYEQARLVRQGKVSRSAAFKAMPDSRRPSSSGAAERQAAEEQETVSSA